MKLVKIIWYDATSDSHWYCREDMKHLKAVRCESVGYVIEENEREIKLCHTISDTILLMGRLVIPKGMIRKTEDLDEVEDLLHE